MWMSLVEWTTYSKALCAFILKQVRDNYNFWQVNLVNYKLLHCRKGVCANWHRSCGWIWPFYGTYHQSDMPRVWGLCRWEKKGYECNHTHCLLLCQLQIFFPQDMNERRSGNIWRRSVTLWRSWELVPEQCIFITRKIKVQHATSTTPNTCVYDLNLVLKDCVFQNDCNLAHYTYTLQIQLKMKVDGIIFSHALLLSQRQRRTRCCCTTTSGQAWWRQPSVERRCAQQQRERWRR